MFRAVTWFLVAVACTRPLESLALSSGIQAIEGNKGDCSATEKKTAPRSYNPLATGLNFNLGSLKHSPNSDVAKTSSLVNPLSSIHSYFSSGNVGTANKDSGWPLKEVTFNHPIQSPIDVITSKAVTMDLPMLYIVDPDMKGVQAKVYNSGHTVYVYIKEDPVLRPYLVGGPLSSKFNFEQMHFHWGTEDIWGSEHFIDGESFAVEIHLVHFNSKYGTFEEAQTKKDGLAVLTIFAEAHHTDNELLRPLHQLMANVSLAKSSVMLESNKAMQWATSALSTNTEYYTYPGSLTTEPYSENVVFILLPTPITLSVNQLGSFRALHSDHHGFITENNRRLQPSHNRPIVRSVNLR